MHFNNNDSFKTVLDRNGQKIHIGEWALIIEDGRYVKAQVCGFSDNYKYVYLIYWDSLYKRIPGNVVIVHNLKNWNHKYHG